MRVFVFAATVVIAATVLVAPATASEAHPTQSEMETLLVCPQCHEQLDESNSSIAQQMKAQIKLDIAAGMTRSEILDSFERQLGPGVLSTPRKHGFDLVAWLLPFAGILVGAIALGYGAWHWSRNREQSVVVTPRVSPELDRRIDDELARFDH